MPTTQVHNIERDASLTPSRIVTYSLATSEVIMKRFEILTKRGLFSILLGTGLMSIMGGCATPLAGVHSDGTSVPFDAAVFIRSRVDDMSQARSGKGVDGQKSPVHAPQQLRFKMITGTGFFVHDGDRLFFVTASHVATNLTPHSELAFVDSKERSRLFRLGQLIRGPGDFKWLKHPDADVSVLEVFPRPPAKSELRPLSLSASSLMSGVPPRASQGVICGFPMSQGTHEYISPITTVVHVASKKIPVKFGAESFSAFLVSPPAGSGFSGGPVFYRDPVRDEYVCCGLLSGGIGDDSGGKLSMVMPAEYILDLLKVRKDESQQPAAHVRDTRDGSRAGAP